MFGVKTVSLVLFFSSYFGSNSAAQTISEALTFIDSNLPKSCQISSYQRSGTQLTFVHHIGDTNNKVVFDLEDLKESDASGARDTLEISCHSTKCISKNSCNNKSCSKFEPPERVDNLLTYCATFEMSKRLAKAFSFVSNAYKKDRKGSF